MILVDFFKITFPQSGLIINIFKKYINTIMFYLHTGRRHNI